MIEKTKKLNNGIEIPVVGLGVWNARSGFEVEKAINSALTADYKLIDTAKIYRNEASVGATLKKNSMKREELFITTKLWKTDMDHDIALKAFEESLSALELEYVDLYLIHWPDGGAEKRKSAWKALEEIYKSGKAKAIGVSNYSIKHLKELLEYAEIKPVLNQVEFHPFLYQKELKEFCETNGIAVEAYSPLAHGEKLNDKRITEIANRYKRTNAQIMLRWNIQLGNIVIPKSVTPTRIVENISIFDFELMQEDIEKINLLNENYRTCPDPDLIN